MTKKNPFEDIQKTEQTPTEIRQSEVVQPEVVNENAESEDIAIAPASENSEESTDVAINNETTNEEENAESEPAEEEVAVEPDRAEPEKPVKGAYKSDTFSWVESYISKIKSVDKLNDIVAQCKDEVARIKATELKKPTFEQRKDFNAKIWAVERIMFLAKRRVFSFRETERATQNKDKVSRLNAKRTLFIALTKQGMSFSNMVRYGKFALKEMGQIVNENVLETLRRENGKMVEVWLRWKAKFLDNDKNIDK